MQTMKAIRFKQYGPPSTLALVDLERPTLRPGEALIEIKASAINPSDVKNVAGAFQAETPRVPGRDFAGVVVEGGDEWIGQEVWGSGAGLGVTQDGAHAQYLALPNDWLSKKPAHLTMEEASAVGVPYLVSWGALVEAAAIQKGETVLITGAGGAVGRAATQIAHWLGATVIGAERSDKASDADLFINIKGKALDAEVKRLTHDQGVDLVLDVVGGPLFEPALKSLRRGGRQVAITSVGNRRVEFDLIDFYHELKRLIGVDSMKFTGQDIARDLDKLRDGFEQGDLEPSPVQTWPLANAVEAYQAVERGGLPAKQILLPNA
jgi:NADPH:quinone reductase-like Zn-dependent oxidoreductase